MREFLRRFSPYFRDYVPRFIQAGIGVVMVAVSTGAITFLIRDVLDEIFINKDRAALVQLPGIIIGLYLIQSVGRYAQTYQLAWIGEDIRLPETDWQGGAGVSNELRTAHHLRDMKMPQGKIINRFGEHIRSYLCKGTDIQPPHPIPFHGLTTGGEQVPHGYDRNRLF